eukprot:GEMP01005141.1.p1 GENE.GEMP01005141.1~~GEMP01005141.1.p1  ORF type:complete len:775 (+),score=200.42 GEMP01005141.1:48-2327(+)
MNVNAIPADKLAVIVQQFKLLSVTPHSSLDDLRTAYRKKLLEAHPDKGGDAPAFQQLQLAYKNVKLIIEQKMRNRQLEVEQRAGLPVKRALRVRENTDVPPPMVKRPKFNTFAPPPAAPIPAKPKAKPAPTKHGRFSFWKTPSTGAPSKPSTGAASKPSTGAASKPSTGAASKPSTWDASKPSTGASATNDSVGSSASSPQKQATWLHVLHKQKGINGLKGNATAKNGKASNGSTAQASTATATSDTKNAPSTARPKAASAAKRRKTRTGYKCGVVRCNNRARRRGAAISDDFGRPGYRCGEHGGERLCSISGCGEYALGKSFDATEKCEAGPRCREHGGGRKQCNIDGCWVIATVRKVTKNGKVIQWRCDSHSADLEDTTADAQQDDTGAASSMLLGQPVVPESIVEVPEAADETRVERHQRLAMNRKRRERARVAPSGSRPRLRAIPTERQRARAALRKRIARVEARELREAQLLLDLRPTHPVGVYEEPEVPGETKVERRLRLCRNRNRKCKERERIARERMAQLTAQLAKERELRKAASARKRRAGGDVQATADCASSHRNPSDDDAPLVRPEAEHDRLNKDDEDAPLMQGKATSHTSGDDHMDDDAPLTQGKATPHKSDDDRMDDDAPLVKRHRRQVWTFHLCDVEACFTLAESVTIHPADSFGPPGRRCPTHSPTSLFCLVVGCTRKALNTSAVVDDDRGPRGRRCMTHGGRRLCNVAGCKLASEGYTAKQTDAFGMAGARCIKHVTWNKHKS